MDSDLDLLREIKGVVDLRAVNAGSALANPDSRASLFFASESIPSAPRRKSVEVFPALTASLR